MNRPRRRRDKLSEDEREQQMTDGGISEYKYLPMVQPETDYPKLYSSNCIKCCPQSNSYIVDPATATLGLEDIVQCEQPTWSLWLLSKVAGWWGLRVIVSPGQCEVMRIAVKTGAVILMTNQHTHNIKILILLLTHRGVIPAEQIYCHLSEEDSQDWCYRRLKESGVNFVTEEDKLLDILKTCGLVIVEPIKYKKVLEKIMISPSNGRQLLIVPNHASYTRPWKIVSFSEPWEVRVDIGQPMSVREMIGARGWDVDDVVQHEEVISRRLRKLSPEELINFMKVSYYFPNEQTRAYQEMRSLLEARGAEMWHCKDTDIDQSMNVEYIDPGCLLSDIEVQRYLECELDSYFLAESIVATCIMTQLPKSFELSRLEDRSVEGGCLVSYDKIVERGILLVQLLGEDKRSLMPCQDLRQFVMEGVHRAEMVGALASVTRPADSQYGAEGGRQRSKSPWAREEDYLWNDDEDRPGVVEDTKMVVGHCEEGRRWLVWMSGMIKYKIENLALVLRSLYRNSKEVFTISELIGEIKATQDISALISDESVTRNSVQALQELDIVNMMPQEEKVLVNILSQELVNQFLKIVLEFRC